MTTIKIKRCRKGHFLTPDNLTGGKRQRCKLCFNGYARDSHPKIKKRREKPDIVFMQNKDKIKNIFLEHVDKTDTCWKWTKNKERLHKSNRHPVQYLQVDRVNFNILNVSHFIQSGEPYRKTFCYNVCDTQNCVNPDHIMCSTGWLVRTVKETCSRGHELTPENSLEYSKDAKVYRRCKICKNQYKREQRRKHGTKDTRQTVSNH